MKRIFLFILISIFAAASFAGGGTTHMLIAKDSVQFLKDPTLRNLILDNFDAYLVGAYYPDSGFQLNARYGENSHWDPFVFNFADYIKETYPQLENENPKLIAFLFGIAAHRVSDEVIHWGFYPVASDHDTNSDHQAEHYAADPGVDFFLLLEHPGELSYPLIWWVPVTDLLNVYHRMGLNDYTREEIIMGNTVIASAGIGERAAVVAAYPYYRWKLPWTDANYYNLPDTGLQDDVHQVAEYQNKLWDRLHTVSNKLISKPSTSINRSYRPTIDTNPHQLQFAVDAIKSGAIKLDFLPLPDGSIEIHPPIVVQQAKFKALIQKYTLDLTS